jgi:catechol 2,3-dioxygenase-like lactoylglutathione lyase family enzyme
LLRQAQIVGIDGIYLPVSDRKQAEAWYMEHLGLEHGGDYLLAGRQEVFLREREGREALVFRTREWLENGELHEMPVVCMRASDIDALYEHVRNAGIRTEAMIEHSWFKEFDLYDPDGNKLKIWQPR